MEIITVNGENFDEVVRNAQGPVLVDFYAQWCGPCKMLAPILDQVAGENDNVTIAKLDIDEALDIAKEFGVMSVPTMIFFKGGEEKERLMGLRPKKVIVDTITKISE